MGTSNSLPNVRTTSDLTIKVRLKDGGLAIDWTGLTDIKAWIYSDVQKAIAGRCTVSIDQADSTLLLCDYSAFKPQYLGVNRIIVQCKNEGRTKTYDTPALNFVPFSTMDSRETPLSNPDDIEAHIEVQDVSSSILDEVIIAALNATERANEAAAAAEHMVDIHTGPEGKSAYEVAVEEGYTGTEEEWLASLKGDTGETPDISIGTVTTVAPGTPASASMTGTPEAPVLNLSIPKGAVGATPNFTVGSVTTGQPGTPVVITITGTAEAPVLNVTIPQGLKGDTGAAGPQGPQGTQGPQGEQGVGFDDVETQQDGTIVITLSNGNTITVNLNHTHPQYFSKEVGTAMPEGGFLPDVVYKLGAITGEVEFLLAAAVTGNLNHYYWMFDIEGVVPTITWPTGITWASGSAPTLGTYEHYEISVLDGIAAFLKV